MDEALQLSMAFFKSVKTDFRQYDRQRIVISQSNHDELVLITVYYNNPLKNGTKLAAPSTENDGITIIKDWIVMIQEFEGPNRCSAATEDKTKRLTIDISEPLHRALKIKAVTDGVTMAEIIRALLIQKFSENGKNNGS
jgi:predicted DNA binding CopG/RHH family protein